jgi:hypothetical protein
MLNPKKLLAALGVALVFLIAVPVGWAQTGGLTMGTGKGGPTPNLVAVEGPDAGVPVEDPPIIRDPVDDPAGAIEDVKPIWNKGWYLAVLAIIVAVARAAQKRIPALRKRESRWAMGITGLITVGTAFILAMTGVAEWDSVFAAAAIAIGAVLWPDHDPKDPVVEKPAVTGS